MIRNRVPVTSDSFFRQGYDIRCRGRAEAPNGIRTRAPPCPTCAGCLRGMAAFEALTATSSHEFCEAVTARVPGVGWYDQVEGEIGDICAWHFKKVAGYNVQLEWPNAQNKCV